VVVIDRGRVIADAPPAQIKARVAGKRISFTAERRLDASDFAGLPVSHLELEDGRVRLLSNEPETVLRSLFGKGMAIHDLEVVGADLEEAFLALTQKAGPASPVRP
jgi:ABC-2 type transport system ATP-binding protein